MNRNQSYCYVFPRCDSLASLLSLVLCYLSVLNAASKALWVDHIYKSDVTVLHPLRVRQGSEESELTNYITFKRGRRFTRRP